MRPGGEEAKRERRPLRCARAAAAAVGGAWIRVSERCGLTLGIVWIKSSSAAFPVHGLSMAKGVMELTST